MHGQSLLDNDGENDMDKDNEPFLYARQCGKFFRRPHGPGTTISPMSQMKCSMAAES